MTEKRFQVFVSSTFRDLEEERQEVMHALLELDCMPAGMELFPAANDSQWNLIKKVIDDCDYYILILAGRYGSIGPEGQSYTEMEYRYALSIGKPVIAFVHRDTGKIPVEKSETAGDGVEKLKLFRTLVETRLCKQWSSAQELGSVVSRSLIQLIKSTPAIGWVRANELADREATQELLRLRRKVEELQQEIATSRISAPQGASELAQGDQKHTFNFIFRSKDTQYTTKSWTSSFLASWNSVFSAIAPHMINEAKEVEIKNALNLFIESENHERLRKSPRFKDQSLSGFQLDLDDFQTIKVQFRALGLIAKSEKNRSVKDAGTYWTLTPYGDQIMTQLRAIRRNEEDFPQFEDIKEGADD
jgi:hypothetical protein